MRRTHFSDRTVTYSMAVLAAIAFFGVVTVVQAAPPARALIASAKPSAVAQLPAHAKAGTGVVGALDPAVLDAPELAIPLPGGAVVTARQTHVARNDAEQKLSWTGVIADSPAGLAVLTRYRGTLAGFVHWGGRVFEVAPVTGGQYVLYEVDPSKVPQGDEVVVPKDGEAARFKTGEAVVGTLSAALNPVVQDVLMVYTAAAEARYGKATLESMILSSVQIANTAYRDSGVNITLAVVGLARVSVVEGTRMGNTLAALQSSPEVAQLRAQTGADLVGLVSENTDSGGIAYIMSWNSPAKASFAHAVVASIGLGFTTLAHEFGHNQGLAHDRETANNVPGVFPYSFGYRRCVGDGNDFMDIMSYSCTNGVIPARTEKFANPSISYRGYATGVSYEIDPTRAADAARSLNETAAVVAGYVQGSVLPPSAPASFEALATLANQVTLKWVDTSGAESGFAVERSTDGVNWSEIATVGSNVQGYTDGTVTVRTTYSYRVRAYNSAGFSAYSNVATIVTTPPAPAAPTGLDLQVSNGRATVSWVDNANDEQGFQVERSAGGYENFVQIASTGADVTSVIDAKFEPYTRYYYRVRAFNAYGVSEYTTVRGFQTGAPVPAAPSGLKATAVSSSQVELSWIDNSSDEVSFAVERSTDGVAFSVVRSLAQNTVTTSDILLQPGTTYHYRVRAANGSGSSDPSNVVSVRTVDVAPRAPLNVLVEAVSSGEVRVRWTDNSANEDGFRIERSTDGANYTQVGTVGRDVLLFVDPTTVPLTGYYYRVSAYNGIGASSYTVATRVTTPDAPPAAPSGLAGAVISDRQVNLTWRDNSANETGFRIERSAGGQFIEVGTTGANVQSFEDRGTSATTTYGYRVRAVNGGGESAYSNVAMVTTPVPLPLAPVGLTATNNRKKTAAVSWQPVEDPPASRYELLRETYKKKTWAYPAVVATVTAGGSLSVIDASGKGTFRYSVRACNEGGCSAYSAPVQVVVTK